MKLGHLKLQNADTRKKLSQHSQQLGLYHASSIKLRLKYAEGPDDTLSEEETPGEKSEKKSSPNCQTSPQSKPVKRP